LNEIKLRKERKTALQNQRDKERRKKELPLEDINRLHPEIAAMNGLF
jgi:hypothetical protein